MFEMLNWSWERWIAWLVITSTLWVVLSVSAESRSYKPPYYREPEPHLLCAYYGACWALALILSWDLRPWSSINHLGHWLINLWPALPAILWWLYIFSKYKASVRCHEEREREKKEGEEWSNRLHQTLRRFELALPEHRHLTQEHLTSITVFYLNEVGQLKWMVLGKFLEFVKLMEETRNTIPDNCYFHEENPHKGTLGSQFWETVYHPSVGQELEFCSLIKDRRGNRLRIQPPEVGKIWRMEEYIREILTIARRYDSVREYAYAYCTQVASARLKKTRTTSGKSTELRDIRLLLEEIVIERYAQNMYPQGYLQDYQSESQASAA